MAVNLTVDRDGFTLNRGDITSQLVRTLYAADGTTPLDLTGAAALLTVFDPTGDYTTTKRTFTLTPSTNGTLYHAFGPTDFPDLTATGSYELWAMVEVTFSGGTIGEYGPFLFTLNIVPASVATGETTFGWGGNLLSFQFGPNAATTQHGITSALFQVTFDSTDGTDGLVVSITLPYDVSPLSPELLFSGGAYCPMPENAARTGRTVAFVSGNYPVADTTVTHMCIIAT